MCVAFFVFAPLAAMAQIDLGETKVTICHIPPGNPANAHTIIVGAPAALAGHQGHGDAVGGCPCLEGEGHTCFPKAFPACCPGTECVADVTGTTYSCQAPTRSMHMPPGGACNSDADCDPLNPCVFAAPGDGVCGGELL